MANEEYVVVCRVYDSKDDAQADLAGLRDMGDQLGKLMAAIVSKDDNGRLHLSETTHAGKVDAAFGAVSGLIIGAIWPPAGLTLLGGSAIGGLGLGAVGGLIGHFSGGIPRSDMREIGTVLYDGQAALVVVGVDQLATDIDRVLTRADRRIPRQVDRNDVDGALLRCKRVSMT
ncbi:MAG: hypothetical protein ACK5LJ_00820 [Paracoccus sp. (in: a-proteobacteria)]